MIWGDLSNWSSNDLVVLTYLTRLQRIPLVKQGITAPNGHRIAQ